MKRDSLFLTVLVGAAFALSCFQMWYISLPVERAVEVDWCRFSETVDCFRSLGKHGHAIQILSASAVAVLFGLLFAQFLGCAFAWTARDQERDAYFALSKILSFASSGVAFYILFQDLRAAEATSVSTAGIAFFGLVANVLVVAKGAGPLALDRAVAGRLGIVASALLCAFLLDGAVTNGREVEATLRRREAAPPAVHWPRFWQGLPRARAARLGAEAGAEEWLVLIDPSQAESRTLLEQLRVSLQNDGGNRTVFLYAPGQAGRQLMEAYAGGTLSEFLQGTQSDEPNQPWSAAEQERIDRFLQSKSATYPSVVTKDGVSKSLPR